MIGKSSRCFGCNKSPSQTPGSYRKLSGRFPEADKQFVSRAASNLVLNLCSSLFQTSSLSHSVSMIEKLGRQHMRHIILIPSTLSSPSSSQAKLRSHISQDGSSISPFLEALVMAEPAERFGLRTNLSLTNVSDLRATYSVSRTRKWPT